MTVSLAFGLAVGAAGLPGCGEPQDSDGMQGVGVAGELGLGATGPAVAAAQTYLRTYGYFPNDELAKAYPAWQPVEAEAPARRDLLDQTMLRALGRLQANLGLPVTGTLNAETLAAMKEERCGVPDTDGSAPRVDKFAVMPAGNRWTKTNITYRFASTGGLSNLNQAQVRAIIGNGIRVWEANTRLTFTEVANGGDFAITLSGIDGASNILAQAGSPPSPSLQFDTAEAWTPIKLVAVTIHEMGHVIGLDHSSFGDKVLGFPIMHPVNHNLTTLTDDDIIGANAMYNGWTQTPGLAIDIGANSIAGISGETVWILGTNKVPYKWNGSDWTQVPGITGTRIDVDQQGHAVVVGTDQRIYRHQGFQPIWVELPGGGRARDVGVGQNGSIWAIGLDNRAWFFNGNGWTFSGGPSNQIAIDVAPSGAAFAVTSGNELWVGSPWTLLANGIGADVGIGGKNNGPGTRTWMFVLGTNAMPFLNDSQAALSIPFPCGANTCFTTAPGINTWVGMGGAASRITAGARGITWVVNSGNQIFRRNEMP